MPLRLPFACGRAFTLLDPRMRETPPGLRPGFPEDSSGRRGLGSTRRRVAPPVTATTVVAALAADPWAEIGAVRHAAAHRGIRSETEAGDVVCLSLEAAAPPSGELCNAENPLEDLRSIAGVMPAGVLRGHLVRQISEGVTPGEQEVNAHLSSDRTSSHHPPPSPESRTRRGLDRRARSTPVLIVAGPFHPGGAWLQTDQAAELKDRIFHRNFQGLYGAKW